MTEKESKKEQVWLTVFLTIPAILFGKIGGVIFEDLEINSIVVSAILGGFGAIVGFGLYRITQELSAALKVSILVVSFIAFGTSLYFLALPQSDASLINSEWKQQTIGSISFEYPIQLNLTSTSIPDGVESIYDKLEIYNDGARDRSISFIYSELLIDSLVLENAFAGSLETMISSLGGDSIELVDSYVDDEEVSSRFSFQVNSKNLQGFGYMVLNDHKLQSIWLLPVSRSFSDEFINRFEDNIEFSSY